MNEEKEPEVKAQEVNVVLSFVLINGLKSIIGYVFIFFFKPVWFRLVNWFKKKN